jgi:predicted RNase H-like HicB family nuclease
VASGARGVYRGCSRLPGANTQGSTLDEARENLSEAVELVLEANRALAEESIRGKDVIGEPLVVAGE